MTNLEKALTEAKPRPSGVRSAVLGFGFSGRSFGVYPFLSASLINGGIRVTLFPVPNVHADLEDWRDVADLDWKPA